MKYLTLNDVRQLLRGRSRSAIYRDIDHGRLPRPIKLGGTLLWDHDELKAHIAGLKNEEGAQAET